MDGFLTGDVGLRLQGVIDTTPGLFIDIDSVSL